MHIIRRRGRFGLNTSVCKCEIVNTLCAERGIVNVKKQEYHVPVDGPRTRRN